MLSARGSQLQIKQFSRIDLNIARLKRNHIAFSRRVTRLHAAFFGLEYAGGICFCLPTNPLNITCANSDRTPARERRACESLRRACHRYRWQRRTKCARHTFCRAQPYKHQAWSQAQRTPQAHPSPKDRAYPCGPRGVRRKCAAGIHHVVRAFALRLVDAHDEAHAGISTLHSLPSPPTNSPSSKAGITAKASSMLPL